MHDRWDDRPLADTSSWQCLYPLQGMEATANQPAGIPSDLSTTLAPDPSPRFFASHRTWTAAGPLPYLPSSELHTYIHIRRGVCSHPVVGIGTARCGAVVVVVAQPFRTLQENRFGFGFQIYGWLIGYYVRNLMGNSLSLSRLELPAEGIIRGRPARRRRMNGAVAGVSYPVPSPKNRFLSYYSYILPIRHITLCRQRLPMTS